MRAGFYRKHAMRISGHNTETTFERYNIVGGRDLHEDFKKLEVWVDERLGAAEIQQPETAPPKGSVQ